MRQKSSPNSRGKVVDGEMKRRVCSIREQLQLDQRTFAERIRASRTQVSEWEQGTEKPSAQKLLAMGNIAPNANDRRWFWHEAGIDEAKFRADVLEEDRSKSSDLVFMLAAEESHFVAVPQVDEFFFGATGQLEIKTKESFSLPRQLLPNSRELLCITVPLGSAVPHFFGTGDLAVIDRSEDFDRLVDCPIAIAFEHHPESIDVGSRDLALPAPLRDIKEIEARQQRWEKSQQLERVRDPQAYDRQEKAAEQTWKRVQERLSLPALKLGWLRLQPAGGAWTESFTKQISRFALEFELSPAGYTGKSYPLSEWKTGHNPKEPRVRKNVLRPAHIIGRIVGWFKAPLPSSGGENAED